MNWIDYAVLGFYLIGVFLIGLYFSKKQTSTDEYFLAGRNIPGWLIAFSLIATLIGSGTFIGHPGEVFATNMWNMPIFLSLLPIMFIIGHVLVPFYRHTVKVSVYGYLEKRFNYATRAYGSLAFLINRVVKVSGTFFFMSLPLAYLTGIRLEYIIIAIGIFTVLYTLLGGIEAVIWTDFIQTVMLLGGVVLSIGLILAGGENGAGGTFGGGDVLSAAWTNHKFDWGNWTFSWTENNVWTYIIVGIIWSASRYGTDQHVVQRYLVAKSDKEARRSAYLGGMLAVPVWILFMFFGACMWGYFQSRGMLNESNVIVDQITKIPVLDPSTGNPLGGEMIVPFFLKTVMPSGLMGLLVAAIAAAAMSTLDSDLNAVGSVVVDDFYARFKPDVSDGKRLFVGRLAVAVIGAVSIISSLFWVGVESAVDFLTVLVSIATAGILGLFLLGACFRKTTTRGAVAGILCCALFTLWASYTAVKLPALGQQPMHAWLLEKGATLNWMPVYALNTKLIGFFSSSIMLATGLLGSLLAGGPKRDYTHLTFWAGHGRAGKK
jgi:SSS family solute:Na+ symporter